MPSFFSHRSGFPNRWLPALLVFVLISSCRRVPTGAGVSFISEPATGLVTMAATGRGIGLPSIEQDAIRTAFETILFVGLPASTSARLPMADPQSTPASFLDQFVQQGRYQPFVSHLERSDNRRRRASGRGKTIRYTLTINQESLRRHLEQQGIIRKLGY